MQSPLQNWIARRMLIKQHLASVDAAWEGLYFDKCVVIASFFLTAPIFEYCWSQSEMASYVPRYNVLASASHAERMKNEIPEIRKYRAHRK
jgi:hypothetical protein